jgi:acetate---CoA ligase (ADP-forming)
MQRLARTIAEAARKSERTFVAYSYSPLGGPLDPVIIDTLHSAGIPYLLGITNAMSVLKHLPARREHWRRAGLHGAPVADDGARVISGAFARGDFLAARAALTASGVPVVEVRPARSADEAAAAFRAFGGPVAVKAEAPGLLHKSDLGCVRLHCDSDGVVAEAFHDVIGKARRAGFAHAVALVQPMVAGVAEAYAGVIDDPVYGPAVCFGLGGIFIEVFKDTVTEMAPLTHDDAMRMIHGIKAVSVLQGARGRLRGDIEALADLLVRLGDFAVAHRGAFRALDLNPIIVKPAGEGVAAVDIAIVAGGDVDAQDLAAKAAE